MNAKYGNVAFITPQVWRLLAIAAFLPRHNEIMKPEPGTQGRNAS